MCSDSLNAVSENNGLKTMYMIPFHFGQTHTQVLKSGHVCGGGMKRNILSFGSCMVYSPFTTNMYCF